MSGPLIGFLATFVALAIIVILVSLEIRRIRKRRD